MYIHRIEFSYAGESAPDNLVDLAERYVGALGSNGQTWGENLPMYLDQNRCIALVLAPDTVALDTKFHNASVREQAAALEQAGIRVSLHIHAEAVDTVEPCKCASPGGYILFASFVTSPVRCMDCFDPVPLYRLPELPGGEYYQVFRWQADSNACDTLELNSSVLEKSAARQLSEVNSSLSKDGRALCKAFSGLTGKPFYYYLPACHEGETLAVEKKRRCPSCGEPWLLDEPLHSLFDFKCDSCGLLSTFARGV